MPEINFLNVLSCSSEEKQHPAENLLKPESIRKWKCKAGERSATVLLQLEKSCQISSVDIGNEHSAFVELLVGRETAKSDDDFQVLLPACAFMNPNESRQSQNGSRVRMFSSDDLAPQIARQKWDRLKIVCSQPFNRNVSFGLAFIRLHEKGKEPDKQTTTNNKQDVASPNSFGRFKMKSGDDEDEAPSPGGMFSKRKTTDYTDTDAPPTPTSTATASSQKGAKHKEEKAEKVAKVERTPSNRKQPEPKEEKEKKERKKARSPSPPVVEAKRAKIADTSASSSSSKKPLKPERVVAFSSLLDGVVFALSGFENPLRSELRQKMLDMGAQYKPNWTRDCTHLICAFANTPKYNEVKGKGKIVKKEWTIDCHKQRKRLSWRKYSFDSKEREGADSETEELVAGKDDDDQPSISKSKQKQKSPEAEEPRKAAGAEMPSPSKTPSKTKTPPRRQAAAAAAAAISAGKGDEDEGEDKDDDVYNALTDEAPSSDEGGNTDDEIERVKERQAKRENKKETSDGGEKGVEKEADKDKSPSSKSPKKKKLEVGPDGLPILPDFFKGFKFLLYGDFPATERRQLNRFITAFGGSIESYMGDAVTHVISHNSWDKSFDEAKQENKALTFLKPEWILECGRLTDLVEPKKYIIGKS